MVLDEMKNGLTYRDLYGTLYSKIAEATMFQIQNHILTFQYSHISVDLHILFFMLLI